MNQFKADDWFKKKNVFNFSLKTSAKWSFPTRHHARQCANQHTDDKSRLQQTVGRRRSSSGVLRSSTSSLMQDYFLTQDAPPAGDQPPQAGRQRTQRRFSLISAAKCQAGVCNGGRSNTGGHCRSCDGAHSKQTDRQDRRCQTLARWGPDLARSVIWPARQHRPATIGYFG